MTETILSVVILLLLIHNLLIQRNFLSHLKELEKKMAGVEDKGKVESPNQIEENHYRDIADVNPGEVKL
jgi:hypothetical protein